MSIFGLFSNFFGSSTNPASGLPMNDDSGVDIGGNLFGTDSMSSDTSFFESSDSFSDPFSSCGCGMDDFSCGIDNCSCGIDDSCGIDTSMDIGSGFGDI